LGTKEKEQILHDHFLHIIGTKEHRVTTINWVELDLPLLPEHHQLEIAFSEEEVREVIAELRAEKTSSPDVFMGVFYRSCWEIIKQDVMASFQCLYNLTAGPLPKWNGALMTLLPVTPRVSNPYDYVNHMFKRPQVLLNF
jgi:hypothetical protein